MSERDWMKYALELQAKVKNMEAKVEDLEERNLWLQKRVHLIYMQIENDFGLDNLDRIMEKVLKEEGER